MNKFLVAIFTYNRGRHLNNCVESLELNMKIPFDLVIYDDDSTDKLTLDILSSLRRKYLVVTNTSPGENSKVKGLYSNMNGAIEYGINGKYNYLQFLQDDVQLVREIDLDYLTSAETVFKNPEVFSISSMFFKKNHQVDFEKYLKFDTTSQMYLPKSMEQKYMTGIADIGLFSLEKITQINWRFEMDEALHIAKGREMGLIRGVTKNPHFSFLPWPSTSRSGFSLLKRVLMVVLDKWYNVGFHPLNSISEESETKLQNRSLFDFPYAEDFLTTRDNSKLVTPWNFYDSFFPFKNSIKRLIKNNG
ncbi:MAG: hypothetical protein COA58_01630 [Bacteroidetes bacterium]|nr:MAG: hypothetical protein COA58_01630 [Bacteroidota bacterium]